MTKLSPISRFTINGNSMFPTLTEGQDILSFNWAYLGRKPKTGDIVIIQVGNKEIIKRVDRVEDNQIYVIGDNPDQSTDSRHFGPIQKSQIIGKLIYSESTTIRHSGLDPESLRSSPEILNQVQNDALKPGQIPCPRCESPVPEVYGRKDAICQNCGFKLTCCGEP